MDELNDGADGPLEGVHPSIGLEGSEQDWQSPDGHHVYVIEILPKLHPLLNEEVPAGRAAFYVGQTAKHPGFRLLTHAAGSRHLDTDRPKFTPTAAPVFRRLVNLREGSVLTPLVDIRLRSDLVADLPCRLSRDDAESLEVLTARRLDEEGNLVYSS